MITIQTYYYPMVVNSYRRCSSRINRICKSLETRVNTLSPNTRLPAGSVKAAVVSAGLSFAVNLILSRFSLNCSLQAGMVAALAKLFHVALVMGQNYLRTAARPAVTTDKCYLVAGLTLLAFRKMSSPGIDPMKSMLASWIACGASCYFSDENNPITAPFCMVLKR
jgi:hypothetical protein